MKARLPAHLLLIPMLAALGLPAHAHAEAGRPLNSAQALSVWTQSTAYKVQPSTAPTSQDAITMEGARASYEAYQVIVRASGAALSGVNLAAGALQDGAGDTIPSADLTFFREDFIDFTGVSAATGTWPAPADSPTGDGRIPDPLVPFIDPYSGNPAGAPFAVPANTNQPVWLDVQIPSAAAAGVYTGTVQVTASSQAPVSVPVTLTVWNITLPDMSADTTWFGLSVDNVINYHRDTYACSGSDCWLSYDAYARTIVKRYEELAHDHRVDTGQAFVPDPSTYLPSNCPLPPTDWSAYDAAVAPYMNGTYWSDGVPSTWLRTPFSPGAGWGADASCTQAQYTALAAAWAAHLRSTGWFSRALVYAADEPDPSEYAAIAQNSKWLQATDPGWKAQIIDTVAPTPSNVSVLDPALGTYVVALAWYDNWAGKDTYGRALWPSLFAQGIKLWFYDSNAQAAPYTSYATNTLLGLEPRMMHWGTWYESASGFLYWSMNAWNTANPWGPNVNHGKTGDGVLIYPGNHDGLMAPAGSPAGVAIDGPIPSYRLKMIRAGLQDWALFQLAAQRGLGAYARAQVARAYGQLGGCTECGGPPPVNGSFYWSTDDALMMGIRHNIALAIEGSSLDHYVYLPTLLR